MTAKIIDGAKIALELRTEVKRKALALKEKHDITVRLVVIIVGNSPASEIYVKNKNKFATECGFDSSIIHLPEETPEEKLLNVIDSLNKDSKVHGILVQLPLPSHISKENVINEIAREKDVDGFHLYNAGLLFTGHSSFEKNLLPCTPKGSLMLIKKVLGEDLSGKKCVVIGASNIVGRPMLAMLLNERCTVSICHSKTRDLKKELDGAEIIVIAIGKANFLKSDMIPQKAVIIDVGINRIIDGSKNKIVGDVDFEDASKKASFITPVPGGVGPMTIACLLENSLIASCIQNDIDFMSL